MRHRDTFFGKGFKMTRIAMMMTSVALMAGPLLAQDTFGSLGQQPPLFGQQPDFGQPPAPVFGQQPAPVLGQQPTVTGTLPGFNPQIPAVDPLQAPQPPQPPQPGVDPQLMQVLAQMVTIERQDYGVQPTNQLHAGAMHGPTPASIPGGQVITTQELYTMMQARQPMLIFHVLGPGQTLPGALQAAMAAEPGSFTDPMQQQLGQYLQQVTQGNLDMPLVFYCASTQCWMSYNSSLRAINLGYRRVLWYRGGLEAWNHARLPVAQGQ